MQRAEASRANARARPWRTDEGTPGPPVDVRRRVSALARTPRLLITCDYDGALTPTHTPTARPDPTALRALRELADLPDTTCAVLSSRPLTTLATLSRLPAEIHLIGAHGAEPTPLHESSHPHLRQPA
ncbi:trehalose-phosphatase, partial [Nocardiopsis sp. CNR-923]|uniref:trehalose-phosphatase n=1 Tax=Nocardiopsis sp. CNR-923 TaxID=1904965 RepID=UPI002915E970